MQRTVPVSVLLFILALAAPVQAWEPQKDIEFVVPSAPGGGSDLNARTIADLAQRENLCPTHIMVLNKPGGSGAVSFSYVAGKKGGENTLMVLHSGQDMGSYVLDWDVKGADLTYLGTVAFDDLILCALAGSEFTDFKKLVEASKTQRITYGGAHKATGDHLSFLKTNKETGAAFRHVMFNSSGEVMAAMLGGHVDLGVFNPSECIGQLRAGTIVALGTFASERLPGELAAIPTFKELGYPNLVVTEVRAVSGPPDMKPEVVAYYENLLRRITESEPWKRDYIEKNFLTPVFMDSRETRAFFLRTTQEALERFRADGLMAK